MKNHVDLYRCEDQIINDAYDRAVVNIFLQKEKQKYKSFLLCGSEPGVGTTSISMELAISLSVAGWKTILVDGDLRKGTRYKRLNERLTLGLSNYICGEAQMEDIIAGTNWELLDYIPCGTAGEESPVRMLCSVAMERVLKNLQESYDYIIMDVPSLNSSVDAQILAAKADASILVAALNNSNRKRLEEARKQLMNAGANLIGVIENKVQMDEYKKYIKDYDYFEQKKYARKRQ